MKKFAIILILLGSVFMFSAFKTPETYEIEAQKNANIHNNKGIMYMKDYWWYAAIQEFKIAISLNPETQASAVYYNNLGECYMKIGYPDLAQDSFERAVKLYSLNFQYFLNLAECYEALGITDKKLAHTYENDVPLNYIMRGLLLEKQGNLTDAITVLDEFTAKEPDLLITPAVKDYIKTLVQKVY